jgi:peptidoglycan pentaglycine glycine transferase (the first glycine)
LANECTKNRKTFLTTKQPMILNEITDKKIWDDYINTHPIGHIFQSYDWGEFRAKSGWHPMRLTMTDNGKIKAAAQVFHKRIPLIGKSIFYIPRGPVLNYSDYPILDTLINELIDLAKNHKAIFLLIDTALSNQNTSVEKYLKRKGFKFSDSYSIVGLTLPKRIFQLNLIPDEETLLKNMSKVHRRNIRTAREKGVRIEIRNDEEALEEFYQLHKRTSSRKNFIIRSFNYQRELLKTFKTTDNILISLAWHNKRVVAARLTLLNADKAWDMYAASDTKQLQLNASYLLLWEVSCALKKRGCTLFDFRGADSPDPNDPLYGLYKYKKGFGPTFVDHIGEHYYIISPFWFKAMNQAKFCAKKALRTFKQIRGIFNFKSKYNEKFLKDTVIRKYGETEELNTYSKILDLGLLVPEEKIIEEYFTKESNILNVGCGAGREGIALMKRGFDVTGIDLQPKMVDLANENALKHNVSPNFKQMDVTQLKLKDNSIDNATMTGSILTYIPKRCNRIAALREIVRILKPKGRVIISTPNRESNIKYLLYFAVIDNVRRLSKLLFKDKTALEPGDRMSRVVSVQSKSRSKIYTHMYSMNELKDDIEEAGLKVIKCRSRKELETDTNIPQQRTKDYFLYFVAEKKE